MDLHFISMLSELTAIPWKMNHGCSFWRQPAAHLHTLSLYVSPSQNILSVISGWLVTLVNERSMSDSVHRDEEV